MLSFCRCLHIADIQGLIALLGQYKRPIADLGWSSIEVRWPVLSASASTPAATPRVPPRQDGLAGHFVDTVVCAPPCVVCVCVCVCLCLSVKRPRPFVVSLQGTVSLIERTTKIFASDREVVSNKVACLQRCCVVPLCRAVYVRQHNTTSVCYLLTDRGMPHYASASNAMFRGEMYAKTHVAA